MRRERERELVRATRALFDERGVQDAPIEEIARAVGIARGLIYRQFASKEELFVLTVTEYLAELDEVLAAASPP
jgi:AcrR family transcriptional regulator